MQSNDKFVEGRFASEGAISAWCSNLHKVTGLTVLQRESFDRPKMTFITVQMPDAVQGPAVEGKIEGQTTKTFCQAPSATDGLPPAKRQKESDLVLESEPATPSGDDVASSALARINEEN